MASKLRDEVTAVLSNRREATMSPVLSCPAISLSVPHSITSRLNI